jgi:hypothetical protein
MCKACSTNGEIQKRVQNFKQNTRKEETTLHSYNKKQQQYYSEYTYGNLIFMDPCIVVWISKNNQQDATL